MDRRIGGILGLLDTGKRIYHIIENKEVSQEEFQVAQVIDQVVFGKKGYAESLGPTWLMIHDPRFSEIENAFIVQRRGRLGGDASVGYQQISESGPLSSSIVDLEQYAEILGEGRTLHWAITHPDTSCPVRQMLDSFRTITEIKAVADDQCTCTTTKYDPKAFKDAEDSTVWTVLTREYPNWFTKFGKPNKEAERLYKLIRADLVGLIDDYAEVPLTKEWVHMETEDIASDLQLKDPEFPGAFLEVIWLEKALSYRAELRVTAYKILKGLGFEKHLDRFSQEKWKNFRLTDAERDQMLRIIYESDYPKDKALMVANLMNFLLVRVNTPVEERLKIQRLTHSKTAKKTIKALKTGELKPIDRHSDGVTEVSDAVTDGETGQVDLTGVYFKAIMDDPRKTALYISMTEAETGIEKIDKELFETDPGEVQRNAWLEDLSLLHAVVEIIKPILADPKTIVDEDKYQEVVDKINRLGYRKDKIAAVHEEEFCVQRKSSIN